MKQNEFEKSLLQLKPYKVYSYSNFKDINPDSLAVFLNRAEKKGLVVKIGKGLFYIRDKKSIGLRKSNIVLRRNNPSGRYELRRGRVSPIKFPIVSNMFWSNKYQEIPLANFISRIISEDAFCYFGFLQKKFGDRKVIEVYLNNFKSKGDSKEFFEEFFDV